MENRYMEKVDDFVLSKELPLEIIESEILPRLPSKSLGRFMCVCKQWKSIISKREFTMMNLHYVSKSLANYKILEFCSGNFTTRDCESLDKLCSVTIRSIPFKGVVSIMGSMHGLVCVCLIETHEAALWNPLTGAFKVMSSSNYLGDYRSFDVAFGFYYDSFNNDYKLLHVVSGALGAYIYSQRSDSWRKIRLFEQDHPFISTSIRWSPVTFLDGSLYYVVGGIIGVQSWIVCFDVKSEKFRGIPFPLVPSGVRYCGSIVVVKDSIHLCISYRDKREENASHHSKGELWKLMDGDGWKKVAEFCGEEHYPHASYKWICVTRNGNSNVILKANNNSYNKLNIEDLATNFSINSHENLNRSYTRTTYVETIASPYC